MPMAPGWPSRSSPPRCRIATHLRLLTQARRRGPACGRQFWTGPSPLHPVTSGRTGTACATAWSSATLLKKVLSCSRAAGSWNAASAGLYIGVGCCGTGRAVWTSPPRAWRVPPPCPASRLSSTRCQSKMPQVKHTQTGSKDADLLADVDLVHREVVLIEEPPDHLGRVQRLVLGAAGVDRLGRQRLDLGLHPGKLGVHSLRGPSG